MRSDAEILQALDRRFATPAPPRIIMAGKSWLVPPSERPAIVVPNDPAPEATQRGPDYRRNLVPAKAGAKVIRA